MADLDPRSAASTFDWNTVTPEAMAALVEGIAECIDWDNPMVTNESGMELLRYLHERGFALTALEAIA